MKNYYLFLRLKYGPYKGIRLRRGRNMLPEYVMKALTQECRYQKRNP